MDTPFQLESHKGRLTSLNLLLIQPLMTGWQTPCLNGERIHSTEKEEKTSTDAGASVSSSDQHCATLWSLLQKALPGESLLLTLANNSLPIASIKVSPLNDVVFGIHPVHSMSCIVNG